MWLERSGREEEKLNILVNVVKLVCCDAREVSTPL
jgi:hypothetical protein